MTPAEIESERHAVVAVALSWRFTRFHHRARRKGVGVDCGQFLLACYEEPGVTEPVKVGFYHFEWFLHDAENPYEEPLRKIAHELAGPPARMPLPGEAVLWRFGKHFSHGGIVIEWPRVIHCFTRRQVDIDDVEKTAFLKYDDRAECRGRLRPMKVYVPKRWA